MVGTSTLEQLEMLDNILLADVRIQLFFFVQERQVYKVGFATGSQNNSFDVG